jgi:hypothetical protein
MVTVDPSDKELVRRCEARLNRGEYRLIVDELFAILEKRQDFAEGFFFLGYARLKCGELAMAADCFAQVVRLKPTLTSVYNLYFPILWKLDRKNILGETLEVFLNCDASGPEADGVRGTWLYNLGESERAWSPLARAIALAPERWDLHYKLGLVASDLENTANCESSLRRSLILKPGEPRPYVPLGTSLESRLALEEAAIILKRGVLVGDKKCLFPLTRVLKSLNRFEESVALARDANIDGLHFRSGTTVGTLDRAGIVDLDGYAFHGAEEMAPAGQIETPGGSGGENPVKEKWHFEAKEISFFPRSVNDFDDLERLVRDHVISRSIPDRPIFAPSSNVLTMGSCFAGHLRKRLMDQKKSTELISVPEGLNNTFALRQFIEWSLTGNLDSNAYWYDEQEDGGIEQWMPPEEHSFYRAKFGEFDGFVITIGLSEVWRDKDTGGVFWRGVPRGIYDQGRHVFQISTVDENTENMQAIVDLVRRHCGDKPIIFTLSPVPLIATHRTDVTCLLADSVSKSILRVAIDQVMRRHLDGVYYWPSFEIVRWASGHSKYRAFGDDDGAPRHVNDTHVSAIIEAFIWHFFREG